MYSKETKSGYKVVALVRNGYRRDDGEELFTVVGVKEKDLGRYKQEYVVGTDYMVSDGTWGNGNYCYSYDNAMKILANEITKIPNLVRALEKVNEVVEKEIREMDYLKENPDKLDEAYVSGRIDGMKQIISTIKEWI